MPGLAARSAAAIEGFNELIGGLRELAEAAPGGELAEAVLDRTGYLEALESSTDLQDASRVENLEELVSVAREFDGSPRRRDAGRLPRAGVPGRRRRPDPGRGEHGGVVTLMTLHTAKGLEFPVVFLTGHGGRGLPAPAVADQRKELEEERRLAYVGITRAQQRLYLTRAVAGTGGGARRSTSSPGSSPRSRRA